jgi:hypothetical protein
VRVDPPSEEQPRAFRFQPLDLGNLLARHLHIDRVAGGHADRVCHDVFVHVLLAEQETHRLDPICPHALERGELRGKLDEVDKRLGGNDDFTHLFHARIYYVKHGLILKKSSPQDGFPNRAKIW